MLPITRYRPKGVFLGIGLSGVSGFLGAGAVVVDVRGMTGGVGGRVHWVMV